MWQIPNLKAVLELRSNLRIPQRMFIGGDHCSAVTGEELPKISPSDGKVFASVPRGAEADVDRAVVAARRAFETGPWPRMTGYDRAQVMRKIADLLRSRQAEFALLESWDNGKPIAESQWAALAAADVFEFYAGWADKLHGEQIPLRSGQLDIMFHVPVGVIGCITPWNFPTTQATFKTVPAIAMGNTVVHKPAEQAPLTALLLAEICAEGGLPPGVWNVVTGLGPEAGAALAGHPGVDAVAFTGSTDTGREVMRLASATLKPVSLECGGKSPNIIFDDADYESALAGAIGGAYYNQGEVCNAGCRVLVHKSIYERFCADFVSRSEKLRVGNPFDVSTEMGAVVSEEQLEKNMSYVAIGRKEGAKLVTGGDRIDSPGYFMNPTAFAEVRPSMRIAQEEIFGPVAGLIPFKDEEDAVQIANGTPYGLASGFWTKDLNRSFRMIRALQSGTVWVNTFGPWDIATPWTGLKQSGVGTEWGREMLRFVTRPKNAWLAV
jgi:acyl-CoA reductase-like NAD-dependent aldehyde dehydrogenase